MKRNAEKIRNNDVFAAATAIFSLLLVLGLSQVSLAQEKDFSRDPSPLKASQVSENALEVFAGKNRYLVKGVSAGEQSVLVEMSSEEIQSFLKNRAEFISNAAKGLQALKWGFGVGAVVKAHLKFQSEKQDEIELKKQAQLLDPGAREDLLQALQRSEAQRQIEREYLRDLTFNEKSNSIILKLLNVLDHQLWQQARIVSRANEFGVMAALGVEFEGGRPHSGWGGSTDIGISIGFNRDEKSLAIQIFHDIEKFKTTQMPIVFIAGLVTKAGFYVANQKVEFSADGVSFYPPMAPGFSTSTQRSFMAGFSSGLTWPPSPLGDLLTYSNKFSQLTWLRVTVSPLTKGFVRLQSGLFKQLAKFKTFSLGNFLKAFFSPVEVNNCSLLF